MERTNKNKTLTIVDESKLSGFALVFTYKIEAGDTKPVAVDVYGNKPVGTSSATTLFSNINVNATAHKVEFLGMTYDNEIAAAIQAEIQTILNTDVND